VLNIFCTSCSHSTGPSGNAEDVLSKDLYQKLSSKYDFIGTFSDGSAIVRNYKYGLIDYKGNEVAECKYDSIGDLASNIRIAILSGAYGAITNRGKTIIPYEYDMIM
jgi:hypothetical protein